MSSEAQYQLLRDRIKAAEDKAATWEQHWLRALEKYHASEMAFIEAREAMYHAQAAIFRHDEAGARRVLFDGLVKANAHIISERKPVTPDAATG